MTSNLIIVIVLILIMLGLGTYCVLMDYDDL